MTHSELNILMSELRCELLKINIPLSDKIQPEVLVNTRAKRRLGCCFFKNGVYTIEVAGSLMDSPEKLRETLAHELLHTCPGCRNHGERWKAYASLVNEKLGFSIQRLAPPTDESTDRLRHDTVKYVLECQSCGAKIYRARMSKAVKHPLLYRCKCGGRLSVYQVQPPQD